MVCLLQPIKNSFACLQLSSSSHAFWCLSTVFFFRRDTTVLTLTPNVGSGPTQPASLPFLANSSAFSLPTMSECPGTHTRETQLFSDKVSRCSLHLRTDLAENLQEYSDSIADSLSDQIKTLFPVVCLSIKAQQDVSIATISD